MNRGMRVLAMGGTLLAAAGPRQTLGWTEDFPIEAGELTSTGRNPYFSLNPGDQLVLVQGKDQLTITVMAATRVIDGVETRVVEERETHSGVPIEVSLNYYAISRRTNSVYYFGENVDVYKDGKIVGHDGGWIAGENGARFGLMMPGTPLLHARYYQELAPRVAMDRAEIVSLSDRQRTAVGVVTDALRVEETTPLEPDHREYKMYARGIGLIQDGDLKLVRATRVGGR
jgi:hypothetical protein